MEPRGDKALSYFLAGLFGVVLPLVALGAEPQPASQEAVDLLGEMPDTGGASLLPEKAEEFGIKSRVAGKFYERTIAGSPYREGKLDWDLLMRLIKDDKTSGPKILKLLPGVIVEFSPKSYEPIKSHSRNEAANAQRYRWTGRITSQGKDVGEGIFIVDEKQQKMSATIAYNDKVYKIVLLKNGNLRIYELNPRRFPEESPMTRTLSNQPGAPGDRVTHDEQDAVPHDPESGSPSEGESTGEPCVIDILVLYTQAAEETWLEKGEDIWDEFYRAIDITNTAFTNSNVRAAVQFADIRQVPSTNFQESGNLDTDLGKLTANAYFGTIARQWRAETGADLVSLWVSGGDWCGASPFFNRRVPTEEDGFSVVVVDCAANWKSFAHEIGHNLGARHTRWDESVSHADSGHNFGHLSKTSRVRTIMATNRECHNEGIYCRRESQYSNPEVPYPGIATMTGVMMGGPNAADNSQYMNETACKAAKYRSPSDQ